MLRPEVSLARKLRRDMSLPEVLLWEHLRGRKAGFKFRHQHPIGRYVCDFYCAAAKLAVEVDGEFHGRGDRPQRDAERDQFFEQNGYRVLRVAAGDVLRDIEAVVTMIVSFAAGPLHQPAAGPPPRAGEE
ncbi:endonuclease domain-containing protein [Sphingomonas faeni]|uniref:endonuclease domain-containing protein n=1 Tax=Sphingomonas faeni TaxID=185950 RepID=UPI0020C7B03B|nr:endonuclease domain-containing protein [Sphingomonas faeni]MCP8889765.1 endonuclease domain-containing protein [Sphingomonas faeni]